MVEKEVWVKVGQTGTAPIVTVYKGPRGLKLEVSVAYYSNRYGNVRPGWFGPGVELYSAKGKLLASGPEAVKAFLAQRGIEYPLED
jgi:hypothetical protein